jgi:oxalate decarboxylase
MSATRRVFLGSAAIGASGLVTFTSVAEATEKYLAKAGDGGFGREAQQLPPGETVAHHDPKDVAEMPNFKFSLDGNRPKVTTGGWAKEATVHQFPISKGIAGVHMYLNPGASRELHWHAIAAEWAYVIDGRCQTVVIDPSGASEINNFEPGDLWYFARGHGHSIQTIGDKPCHFILSFDNGAFSEHGTFSITDWVNVTPKDMLALHFGSRRGSGWNLIGVVSGFPNPNDSSVGALDRRLRHDEGYHEDGGYRRRHYAFRQLV